MDRNSNLFGTLFEQWVAMELRAFLSYNRIKQKLMYWRTDDGLEVDFIIEGHIAVEVKSSRKISNADLKSLKILRADPKVMENGLINDFYLLSNDPVDRLTDGVHILHWRTFMTRLWEGKIVKKTKTTA